MTNLNVVTIIGRLTADAETRVSGTKKSLFFSVACSRGKDAVDFIPVRVNAAMVGEKTVAKLTKGAPVRVTGRFECGRYQDGEGKSKSYAYLAPEVIEVGPSGNFSACQLMGRLTADPQLRQTTSGKSVVSFCIACNRQYKDKAGEWKDAPTSYVNATAWENMASFIAQYFHKGDPIAIAGELRSRKYQDAQGNNRVAYEVVSDKASFASIKKEMQPEQPSAAQQKQPMPAAKTPATNSATGGDFVQQTLKPQYGAYSSEDFEAVEDEGDLPF